jgi:hypothetical protein
MHHLMNKSDDSEKFYNIIQLISRWDVTAVQPSGNWLEKMTRPATNRSLIAVITSWTRHWMDRRYSPGVDVSVGISVGNSVGEAASVAVGSSVGGRRVGRVSVGGGSVGGESVGGRSVGGTSVDPLDVAVGSFAGVEDTRVAVTAWMEGTTVGLAGEVAVGVTVTTNGVGVESYAVSPSAATPRTSFQTA